MKQSWRMLFRIAVFQGAVGLVGAGVGLGLKNIEVASVFFLGVALVALTTLVTGVFALRRAKTPAESLAKVLGASFSRWLLIIAGVYFALKHGHAGLPLMLGVVVAQLSAVAAGLGSGKF
jgi:hypothetical protein